VLALTERIEAADRILRNLARYDRGKDAGRISIGAVSTANISCPFADLRFSRAYPNVDVSLFIGIGRRSARLCVARSGYRICGRPAGGYRHEGASDRRSSHVIIAPTGHRWRESRACR